MQRKKGMVMQTALYGEQSTEISKKTVSEEN